VLYCMFYFTCDRSLTVHTAQAEQIVVHMVGMAAFGVNSFLPTFDYCRKKTSVIVRRYFTKDDPFWLSLLVHIFHLN